MAAAREVALALLAARFGRFPGEAGRGRAAVALADFQTEALDRVRAILARRGGAILADSVGLGKTYVALALIEEQLRASGDAIVLVPASLRPFWRRELRRHRLGACRVLSHARLARGAGPRAPPRAGSAPEPPSAGRARAPDPREAVTGRVVSSRSQRGASARLIVVDEAHRFRNPSTRRHAALARLAPGSRVLMLTATPVNNTPGDLLHLIRLFARDDGFRDLGVASLEGAFAPAAPAGQLRAVVRSVVVRRTRRMVREAFGDGGAGSLVDVRFPRRARPRIVRYRDARLPARVRTVGRLELGVYGPGEDSAGHVALARLGLLKRLDSSRAAFRTSVRRLEALIEAALDAAVVGRLLDASALARRAREPDGDPMQLSIVELTARPAPPDLDLIGLGRSLGRDLRRLRGLRRSPEDAGLPDPKAAALESLVESAGGDRVLVFTEYRDTAEALWKALLRRFRVGRVDGSGAWLGSRRAGRRTVIERFAPIANGRRPPPARERVDVLIATDVLAEGLNLQDARHVVSYDLPWNPVRLLQRIGRIDRLGSPHDEVVPYLFVPERGLEEVLRLTGRVRAKLGSIARTVGAESAGALIEALVAGDPAARAASDSEEDPTRRARRPDRRRSEVEDALDRIEERADAEERLRTLWARHRGVGPGLAPAGWATAGLREDHSGARLAWVVGVRSRAGAVALLEIDREGAVTPAGERTADLLETILRGDMPCPSTPEAPHRGHPDRAAEAGPGMTPADLPIARIAAHLRSAEAAARAPGPLRTRKPGGRLARRLRQAIGEAGCTLDRDLLDRADALLDRLARPLTPAESDAAAELLTELVEGDFSHSEPIATRDPHRSVTPAVRLDRLVSRADAVLGSTPQRRTGVEAAGRPSERSPAGSRPRPDERAENAPDIDVIGGLRIRGFRPPQRG